MEELEKVVESLASILGIIASILGLYSFEKKRLKIKKNIILFINDQLYNRIAVRTIGSAFILFVVAVAIAVINTSQGRVALRISDQIIIMIIASIIQALTTCRTGLVGIDKEGNKKDYKFSFLGLNLIVNIMMLWSFHHTTVKETILFIIICIVIISGYSMYIVLGKKITCCKSVRLVLDNGEPLDVSIDEYVRNSEKQISIVTSEKKVIINEEHIVSREVTYTDEYREWLERAQKEKMSNKEENKRLGKKEKAEKTKKDEKSDLNWWIVVIAVAIAIISIVIELSNYGNTLITQAEIWNYLTRIKDKSTWVGDLFTHQITISAIFVSVMTVVIGNLADRYVGISAKGILFKRYLYEWNYLTLVCITLLMDAIGFVAFWMESRLGILATFLITMICIFRMMQLTYYMVSKKSKIYDKIEKKLKKNNMDLYNLILKKERQRNGFIGEKTYNSYIAVEKNILYKMQEMADKEEDKKIIRDAAKKLLKSDVRTKETLLSYFKSHTDWIEKLYAEIRLEQGQSCESQEA